MHFTCIYTKYQRPLCQPWNMKSWINAKVGHFWGLNLKDTRSSNNLRVTLIFSWMLCKKLYKFCFEGLWLEKKYWTNFLLLFFFYYIMIFFCWLRFHLKFSLFCFTFIAIQRNRLRLFSILLDLAMMNPTTSEQVRVKQTISFILWLRTQIKIKIEYCWVLRVIVVLFLYRIFEWLI